jgi:hypothetical protein
MSNQVTARTATNSRLEKFFARVDPVRGRLIFAVDATASRAAAWDAASQLTFEMFNAAASAGSLAVQLIYFRGRSECVASRWFSDARSLSGVMAGVMCRAGRTKIGRVLSHVRKENGHQKVNAVVLVSDACEETPSELYAEARQLVGVPVFMFQEGDDQAVTKVYGQIADITGGAACKFDHAAAQRLADLLKAVAAFAAGGMKALADQNSEAAKLLLTQIRK